jgi:mRNA interferase MazF
MRRAEVWWAELPSPIGSRPVVVLTRDAVLQSIGSIVVTLVTRTNRGLPTEVELGRRQGLPIRCVANLDNILTVPRERLKRLMGACDTSKVGELNQAVRRALDLPLNCVIDRFTLWRS